MKLVTARASEEEEGGLRRRPQGVGKTPRAKSRGSLLPDYGDLKRARVQGISMYTNELEG